MTATPTNTALDQAVQTLIEKHHLNPVTEKRPRLAKALNLNRQTQWRHEKKHDIQPAPYFAGDIPQFETAPYLAAMLTKEEGGHGGS